MTFFSRPYADLYQAEVLEGLAGLPDASFDAVLCDPPYELGFMGRAWDRSGVAFRPETWAAVARVCKPGAHLLAFGGTRTFHRLTCAIEDAGWEIRDTLMWVYGSGFPKSLDVSKAIDKERAEDHEPVRRVCRFLRAAMDAKALKSNDLAPAFRCHSRLVDHWAARDTDSQPALPKWDQWLDLKRILGLSDDMDAEVWRLNGRKGTPGEAWQTAEVVGEYAGVPGGLGGERFTFNEKAIKAPSTPAAQLWSGYGTALKPAWEPVILARKPLEGTVAQNVQKWGCGALWIDGGRIGTEVGGLDSGEEGGRPVVGRWPANLLHDGSEEVVAGFPESISRPVKPENIGVSGSGEKRGIFGNGSTVQGGYYDVEINAARFFYCAKASREERVAGLGPSFAEKAMNWSSGEQSPGTFQSDGTHRASRNPHPTVKPLDLCRYLAGLVLPPAGRPHGPRRILVPFAGSGSEMIGTILAGWDHVTGIEREADYCRIAGARLRHWASRPQELSLMEAM